MTHGLIQEPPLTSGDNIIALCLVPESQVLLEEGSLEFLAAACHPVFSVGHTITVTDEGSE